MGTGDAVAKIGKEVFKKVANEAKDEAINQATNYATQKAVNMAQGSKPKLKVSSNPGLNYNPSQPKPTPQPQKSNPFVDQQKAKLQEKINLAFNEHKTSGPQPGQSSQPIPTDSKIADAENRIAQAQEEANKLKSEEIEVEKERVDVERDSSKSTGSSSSSGGSSALDEDIKPENRSFEISANLHTTSSSNMLEVLLLAIFLDVFQIILSISGNRFYDLNIILDIPFIISMKKRTGHYSNNFWSYVAIIFEFLPFLPFDVFPLYSASMGYNYWKYKKDVKDPTGMERQKKKIAKAKAAQAKLREKLERLENVEERLASTSRLKLTLAFGIALAWDIGDILSSIATGTADEWSFDYFGTVDTAVQYSLYKLCGVYYKKLALLEYIPYVDWFFWNTLSVYVAMKAYKRDLKVKSGDKKAKEEAEKSFNKIKISLSTGQTSFLRKATISLVLLLIIFSGLFLFTDAGPRFIKQFSDKEFDIDLSPAHAMDAIRFKLLQATNYIQGRWSRSIGIATGDYDTFEGTVENLNKNVGLKLQLDKTINSFFISDKSVNPVLFATVSGRGLDPEICGLIGDDCVLDGEIKLGCSVANPSMTATINPSTITFSSIEDSYYDATCSINVKDLPDDKKSELVYFTSDFDFMTMGYKRSNFIDADRKRELDSEEGFKFPVYEAKFTPGPVAIKFNEINNPLLVGNFRRMQFKFSIENVGNGKINKFKKIAFKVPEGVVLEQCNYDFKASGSEIVMNEDLFNTRDFQLVEKTNPIRIACSLDLSSSKILDLNNVYTTDSFKVLVAYEYSLRESMQIKFERALEVKDLTECYAFCTSDGGCRCVGSGCNTQQIIPKFENCVGDKYTEWQTKCIRLPENECNAVKASDGTQICTYGSNGCELKFRVS
ncbi:hypothetical protein KY334_07825 [Candidatus Woesearchaeota archaeon]|nr:hypothetical protein [Candidatus Woesearchaeota archaeon]